MSRTRWFDLAAIALTVAVLVGLGFVFRPQETPTITVAPSTAHVDRPQPPAATRPSVLFIGDSYTAGSGLRGDVLRLHGGGPDGLAVRPFGRAGNRVYQWRAGQQVHRRCDPYLGPSTSFAERIPNLAAKYEPDIVVLDGGRNDLFRTSRRRVQGDVSDDRRGAPSLANGDDRLHQAEIPGPARR